MIDCKENVTDETLFICRVDNLTDAGSITCTGSSFPRLLGIITSYQFCATLHIITGVSHWTYTASRHAYAATVSLGDIQSSLLCLIHESEGSWHQRHTLKLGQPAYERFTHHHWSRPHPPLTNFPTYTHCDSFRGT